MPSTTSTPTTPSSDVYVLTYQPDPYEPGAVVGVFTSEELAEAEIKRSLENELKDRRRTSNDFLIEPFVLNVAE